MTISLPYSGFHADFADNDSVDRQKQHMAQLEQRLRESDLQVHGTLLGRGASYGDMCVLRLQVGKKDDTTPTIRNGIFTALM